MRQTLLVLSLSILVLTSCQKSETIDSNISARPGGGNGGGGSSTVNLTQGLVAFYPFNGNANDASGNGNNGTVNGATLTTDRFKKSNRAYSFDGDNDYINTTSSFYNPSINHSVSMWFLIGDTNRITNTMFNTDPHRIESIGWNTYFLNPLGGFSYCLGDAINWPLCGSSYSFYPTFSKSRWNNLTFIKNGTDYNFYLNGILVHTQPSVDFMPNSNVNIWIGAISGGFNPPNEEFFGKLDDIRIYNRALNQAEITYLARN